MESKNDIYIIFLDIDGVLYFPWNNSTLKMMFSSNESLVKEFNKNAVNNLEYLIRNITLGTGKNVGIVLSSTWRHLGNMDYLRKLFQPHFFANYLIDKTPDINVRKRGLEILTWLHNNYNKMNILNFVVLDDSTHIGLNIFREHFIWCDEKILLTKDNSNTAIDVLFRKSYTNAEIKKQIALLIVSYTVDKPLTL